MAQSMFGSMYDAKKSGMDDLRDSAYKTGSLGGRGAIIEAATLGGGMLGRGASRAFGGLPQAEAKQAKIQELMQLHPNPESYEDFMAVANDLKNAGLMAEYEKAFEMAQKLKPTGVKQSAFGEKLAFIKAKKDAGEPLTDIEKKILGGGTTVNVGAGDTAYGKEIGKISATEDHALVKFARGEAIKGLEKTDRVLNILDSGKASTGMLAELDLVKNRFLGIFGNQEAIDSATKTQVLEAFLGSDVFPMISALGIGARGLDTPAEREFLISVMTGRKEMTPDAIRELTDLRRRLNYNIINEYNDRLADGNLDRYQDERGIKLKPVKVSYRPPYNSKPGNIQGTRVFKLITGEYVDVYGKPFKPKKGK
jgi:hypothetical protein